MMKPNFILYSVLLTVVFLLSLSMPARAQEACYNPVSAACQSYLTSPSTLLSIAASCGPGGLGCCNCLVIRANLSTEMDRHRRSFFLGTYWTNTVFPGLRNALNNVTASVVGQSASLGGFVEAQNNVNTLQALQSSKAKAVRDAMPSESVCRFGSLSQGLAADEAISKTNQEGLASIGLNRNLGAEGTSAQAGASEDREALTEDFCSEYANENDNNSGLALMCGTSASRKRLLSSIPPDQRYNRDINYTATIDTKPTIQMDFTKAPASDQMRADQQDVVTLGRHLYGAEQLSERYTKRGLQDSNQQLEFMKTRSLYAARGVAQNSYAAIAGMRARGSGKTAAFFKGNLASLGLSEDQVKEFLSENPSYFAQMEILTKKLYQSPQFYAGLMGGKANLARQTGSMEGLQLMQDRDIYQSVRRSEMLLAVLVQLQARQALGKTASDINTVNRGTP